MVSEEGKKPIREVFLFFFSKSCIDMQTRGIIVKDESFLVERLQTRVTSGDECAAEEEGLQAHAAGPGGSPVSPLALAWNTFCFT